MEVDFINDAVKFLGEIDFTSVYYYMGFGFFAFWFAVVIWVWRDSANRYQSKATPILFTLLTLFGCVFGLLIYIVLRPKETLEEKYWAEKEKEFLMHEVGDYDICPKCHYDKVFAEFLVCPSCGHKLKHKCEGCGFALTKHWKHCPQCGRDNPKYDQKAKSDPNEVLVGDITKREQVEHKVETAKKEISEVKSEPSLTAKGESHKAFLDAKKEVAQKSETSKAKEEKPTSWVKLVLQVYGNFFAKIGEGVVGLGVAFTKPFKEASERRRRKKAEQKKKKETEKAKNDGKKEEKNADKQTGASDSDKLNDDRDSDELKRQKRKEKRKKKKKKKKRR